MTNPETQLTALFARYAPPLARLGKALRTRLRARLPGLTEVVYFYERQHSLVIAYSPSGRGHDAVCSLAVAPQQVKLFLARSPLLAQADPDHRLQGSGKLVRYVPIAAARDLDRGPVRALLDAAIAHAQLRFEPGVRGAVQFRVEAQQQRAARARSASRPGSPSRAKNRQR